MLYYGKQRKKYHFDHYFIANRFNFKSINIKFFEK